MNALFLIRLISMAMLAGHWLWLTVAASSDQTIKEMIVATMAVLVLNLVLAIAEHRQYLRDRW